MRANAAVSTAVPALNAKTETGAMNAAGSRSLALASPHPTQFDFYAPGPVRSETDAERAAVGALLRDCPEFARLPYDVIQQHLDYGTRMRAAGSGLRRAEGIPEDWRYSRDIESTEGVRWSDDV